MDLFEREVRQLGYRSIAGVDEAGRGPLAGPVVAAAVILPPGYQNGDIHDSKTLSASRREKLFDCINGDAVSVGIAVVEHAVIDEINILRATLRAMEEAVSRLTVSVDYLLIDGRDTISLPIPQQAVIKGDSRSISVASASIIAKVTRDRIMDVYHRIYPEYNFQKHKGYGTREHREAIRKHGLSQIHRQSFKIKMSDLTEP
ncbi:MAG: ribonuclease HII [Deltaproteobacteria bacterium]|nr:ribonuclease HII [Deltaproteobacteria bacterium]MBN2687667.1 ribonuclease HII [Deltaproteobacteria bacterium]